MADEKPALLGGPRAVPGPLPPHVTTGAREVDAALEVLKGGILSDFIGAAGERFLGGAAVRALESAWSEHFAVRHALSVNSATSGLHAAVVAAGVGPGDEVIVPPQTMSATATSVALAGGTPVFVDSSARTACLDPEAVENALTERTRAILAVNLFGGPAEVVRLRSLADRHGLVLIEDNAQSPGGRKEGRWLGTIGHLGVFSLNFHKAIQCGEGGVVVTDDERLARRVALVRNHGENAVSEDDPPEDLDLLGLNYRLTELQAAIARVQLERLEELTAPRIEAARALDAALETLPGLSVAEVAAGDRHVYYVYPVTVDPARLGLDRDLLVRALQAEGLPVFAGYVAPLYRLPVFRRLAQAGRCRVADESGVCPNAERLHGETLLYTTLVEAPEGARLAECFGAAVEKIVAHADEVRRALT